GQREGVRAVEYLLTGREIELRLVVVKRFVEVDGNAVEGLDDRGEPVEVDLDEMVEPHSGEFLDGGDGTGRAGVESGVDHAVEGRRGPVAGVVAGRDVGDRVARDLDGIDA